MLNFAVGVTFPKKKRFIYVEKFPIYPLYESRYYFFFVSLHLENEMINNE